MVEYALKPREIRPKTGGQLVECYVFALLWTGQRRAFFACRAGSFVRQEGGLKSRHVECGSGLTWLLLFSDYVLTGVLSMGNSDENPVPVQTRGDVPAVSRGLGPRPTHLVLEHNIEKRQASGGAIHKLLKPTLSLQWFISPLLFFSLTVWIVSPLSHSP